MSVKVGLVNRIARNTGYVTEGTGSASVSNAGTITHGLAGTPTHVTLTTSAGKHIAAATALSATTITVALHDDTGSAVTVAEPVYWSAAYTPA